MNSVISKSLDWDFELLEKYEREIARIATEFQLDTYPCQIEIITSEQMIDAYSAVGMPIGYYHWSFGKQFLEMEQHYKQGHMGLAYEIVINSNPCIAYLLEENSLAMQAIVIAHACYGHNSFFKGNYLFKTWTNPNAIIDYLVFSRNYIAECEEKYGIEAVEEILDACHSLMNYGVDRYKRPVKISENEEKQRHQHRAEYLQTQMNELWNITIPHSDLEAHDLDPHFPSEPQENILYFIEKNSPLLEDWQREIIRIVRKIAQYFYPQRQTKVMNEGWATFWHYTIIQELHKQGFVNDQFMLEFMHNHTNVLYQPPFDAPEYPGLNPYVLGFKMMQDIRRICEEPTEEDKIWFPNLAGTDWLTSLDFAMRNFKDESFIAQYLSPRLIRELRLFTVLDDDLQEEVIISDIHNEEGYQHIRDALSKQFNLSLNEPNIQIYNVDQRGDRSLTLRHIQTDRRPLHKDMFEVIKYIHQLWKFTVRFETQAEDGSVKLIYQFPQKK